MLSKRHVLVVDEHPQSVSHMQAMLKGTGLFEVQVARTAAEALSLLESRHFQLVIIDMNMPDMDSLRFISELCQRRVNTMLVLVSACSQSLMNSVSLVAQKSGLTVMGAFQKPFSEDALRQLLQRMQQGAETTPQSHDRAPCTFERRAIENALQSRGIQAWFQPKIALGSGRIIGAEALARWDHPEYGFMLAGSFLDAIHHYGLQKPLLLRILEDAMEAHLLWQRCGYQIPVSVNLPVSLLDDPQLPDELFRQVTARGVDTANGSFELLEDEAISHVVNYHTGSSRLRLKRFGLAQDDFGRGYSSMYRLISTPFTELKVDRSFVHGVADDDIRKTALNAVVQLGRQLGLTVTAEGVETMRDLQFLRHIGCDYAQGFLISAAIGAERFGMLLASEVSDRFVLASPTR